LKFILRPSFVHRTSQSKSKICN